MKMMSSTSITSTSGTTLISASERGDAAAAAGPSRSASGCGVDLRHQVKFRLGDVQELHREVVHLRREQLHAVASGGCRRPRAGMAAARPGRRGDERFGDAGCDDAETGRAGLRRCSRNAIMMPHTVPNSPMNGVMLAVVARNGTRLLELVHLDDRRAQQRAIDGRQTLQSWTTGGAAADWVRWRRPALVLRSCAVSSA